jgi:hypothetical protein
MGSFAGGVSYLFGCPALSVKIEKKKKHQLLIHAYLPNKKKLSSSCKSHHK